MIGLYIAALLLSSGISSLREIIYDYVFTKGREQYEREILEKMNQLPCRSLIPQRDEMW